MNENREMIVVNNLRKEFQLSRKQRKANKEEANVKVAVDNLSFSVYQGEIFGLLGPNGAGKTTTLRMLSTLVKPTSGEAFVCGNSVVNSPESVRKHIGFLTGELKLEDYFTPEYLFNFFSEFYSIDKNQVSKRKEELFEKFGINKYREKKIGELSTGMKQKVSLVISIVHDPEVVIFDEPTNGLDIVAAKVVTDFLLELKKLGKTVIVSTHIFELIEKICDRVGIVVDGKMILCDSLKSVTRESNLETVFFDMYERRV